MTEKEKIEELLKPRYKVIADYPFNSHFKVEEVIVLNEFDGRKHLAKEHQEWFKYQLTLDSKPHISHSTAFYESYLNNYPHIFKKLKWWEEREEKDMPEYIKPIRAQQYVFKVYTVVEDSINFENRNGGFSIEKLSVFLPATKEEYNNQKEEIKKQ